MTPQSVSEAKAQARSLRQALDVQGTQISHSSALELVAQQNGARDWNTLQARLAKSEPQPFHLNDAVRGRYLGQGFSGRIVALSKMAEAYRISIQLNQPIDAVRFDGFSNMRRHLRGIVDRSGRSLRKTSDGVAQLIIEAVV